MRKNLFDLFKNHPINYYEEIQRIEHLFSEETYFSSGRCKYSMAAFINKEFIHLCEFRGTFLNLEEMRSSLGISINQINDNVDLDRFLLFLELIVNMINLLPDHLYFDKSQNVLFRANKTILDTLQQNIDTILEKLNSKIEKIDNKFIIVSKNPTADAVAEKHEDIRDRVIEYNRFHLKGDLKRKKEILLTLGNKFDPLRTELKQQAKDLESHVGFLLNNLNIRHNNKEGKDKKDFVVAMKADELENWYDTTYDLLLLAMLTNDYIVIKTDLDDLKSKINQ